MKNANEAMWCVVMFDLPVKTAAERRSANKFRQFLLDSGYSRVQYSVYVQYLPLGVNLSKAARDIKKKLPSGGEVRIVPVTDQQWSNAFRFANGRQGLSEEPPEQLEFLTITG